MNNKQVAELSFDLREIERDKLLKKIEDKFFKSKRPVITLNQQILFLFHLGMLDSIYQLPTSNTTKALLLARILNADASNTKKALEAVANKTESRVKTSFNYTVLEQIFQELDLKELSLQTAHKLKGIESTKCKKK